MTAAPTYIQVLLPLKLQWIPTYSTPTQLEPGRRVCVALGRRSYDGVVWRCLERPDLPPERIQPVLAVQDDLPSVTEEELRFWAFLADYYLCTPGEVYKAAYPLLKVRSEHTAADILARLHARLEKKEKELEGRHNDRVTQRLTAARDQLLAQIAACSRSDTPPAPKIPPGKPLVLTGANRRDAYPQALREALDAGRQALILTPEIAFCDKMEALLGPEFGPRLHLFHSGKTPVQRRHAAEALRSGAPAIILGTRSALFLPFRNLELVIIDEEQDPSYKQTEPAPRYHGRDAAVALAGIHGARVLLGAAVPSLETLLNVRTGKYELKDSPGTTSCAEVIDIPAERRKNGMAGSFSRKLIDAVRQTEGPVVLLRGWEKADALAQEAAALFPERGFDIRTLGALKREGAPDAALIAVLQADALVSREDFRGDERAAQIVGTLCQFAPRVIIQTTVPARFDGRRSPEDLLEERRQFRFPPFTRLVEVRRQGDGAVMERHFFPRDKELAARKAELLERIQDNSYPDVDPID